MRLFSLLATSQSQPLTAQLVALLAALLRDGVEGAALQLVQEHGMMPLSALLANGNEYITTRTLLLLLQLAHEDSLRAQLRLYLDLEQLEALTQGSSATLRQLAASLRHLLAL